MYKRIVLKLSGEALAGEKKGVIFDDSIIWGLIAQIKAVMAKGLLYGHPHRKICHS